MFLGKKYFLDFSYFKQIIAWNNHHPICHYKIIIISGGTTGVQTVRRTGAHGPRGPIQAPY